MGLFCVPTVPKLSPKYLHHICLTRPEFVPSTLDRLRLSGHFVAAASVAINGDGSTVHYRYALGSAMRQG
jgi:hypothetical protein